MGKNPLKKDLNDILYTGRFNYSYSETERTDSLSSRHPLSDRFIQGLRP